MNENKVQKLSDEALDEVAGGKANFGSSSSDTHIFAMEIAPMILVLCRQVKEGADRDTVWSQNCEKIASLITAKLPAGTRFDINYAKIFFDVNC